MNLIIFRFLSNLFFEITLVTKLANVPNKKVAGVDTHTPVGTFVQIKSPSKDELNYALSYLSKHKNIFYIQNL